MEKKEIFTVENAKVANLNYRFYSNAVHGYLKDGDGLVFVVVIRTLINLKEQKVTTLMRDSNGKEYVRYGDFNLYLTPKDYENGNSVKPTYLQTWELIRSVHYKTLCECLWVTTDEETDESPQYGYISVWIFENGEPKRVPVVVNAVNRDDNGWHLSDGCLPEKYWESKEDAFSFNEYKVVDEDGEEFIEQGLQKRVGLTTEQWAIIKEMQELFKKAKDSDIKFLWNRDNCGNLEAINMANAYEIGYEVESFEGGRCVSLKDVYVADTGICFYDYCGCDSSDAISLKPTEREKKIWLKQQQAQSQE